jgi:hypothetical protein
MDGKRRPEYAEKHDTRIVTGREGKCHKLGLVAQFSQENHH